MDNWINFTIHFSLLKQVYMLTWLTVSNISFTPNYESSLLHVAIAQLKHIIYESSLLQVYMSILITNMDCLVSHFIAVCIKAI